MSNDVKDINDLIEKLGRLIDGGVQIDPPFTIHVHIMKRGFVLEYYEGRSSFNLHYEPSHEAIEGKQSLIERLSDLIDEKSGDETP